MVCNDSFVSGLKRTTTGGKAAESDKNKAGPQCVTWDAESRF